MTSILASFHASRVSFIAPGRVGYDMKTHVRYGPTELSKSSSVKLNAARPFHKSGVAKTVLAKNEHRRKEIIVLISE